METSTCKADEVCITTPSQYGQIESLQAHEKVVIGTQKGPIIDNNTGQQNVPTTSTNLKRRRVSRACDACRGGKIKCDGKQPCTHCTVYGYDCTFDQPSKRRRHVTPQYVESLETQLKRAKTFLSIVCPTLNLQNDSIELHLQTATQHQPLVKASGTQQILRDPIVPHGAERSPSLHLGRVVEPGSPTFVHEEVSDIYHNYHAQIRLQGHAESVIEPPSGNLLPVARRRLVSPTHDTPQTVHRSVAGPVQDVRLQDIDLPCRKVAQRLCERALLGSSTLVHVVHVPTFNQSMKQIYEFSPEDRGVTERTFLPLLYAVLSVGVLLSDEADLAKLGYNTFMDEGFKYFRACRRLLHVADCNDLTSLQAIVFMIQFSLAFTKLSTCYSYIGVALRSALHMGLHRSSSASFNQIDVEVRKRLFWSIRKMDTYVGTMLGLPIFLSDEDIDQDWPIEVEDDQITATRIQLKPGGDIPVLVASNAHTRIIQIFAKICKRMYPIKGSRLGTPSVTGMVSYLNIMELENDLERWLCDLPSAFKIGGVEPPTVVRQRVSTLLRMAYCHAQMLLYRPFLHYISQSHTAQHVDQRAIVCANGCISASRKVMHIAIGMKQQGLLVAADWLTTYSTFSAVVSILDFITENPYNPVSYDAYQDAVGAKDVLAYLARRSVAAGRCASTLDIAFDRLPKEVKRDA